MERYLCKWLVSERDARLYELATNYHRSCEAYDRIICTGPVRYGEIFPATPQEFSLINKNALKVRKVILEEAGKEGFSSTEVLKAIRQVGHAGIINTF